MTQTIDIPANRRVRFVFKVPHEILAGKVFIAFTPVKKAAGQRADSSPLPGGNALSVEEALQMAEAKAADPNRKPISRHFGTLSKNTFGDPVAYQRAIRDEWD